jgi:hypothetical protein
MNQSHQKAPYIIILLLLVGAAAFMFAFWLVDHPQRILDSGVVIAVFLGIFLVLYVWAFLLYFRWRDEKRAMIPRTAPSTILSASGLEGTVSGMIPGRQYRVVKSFTDHYGNSFEQNELLRFKERHFLPYHGGHTIVFDERSLYLQEESNREILENFSEYILQTGQERSRNSFAQNQS